jgi:predicted Zn-dependent protease
MPEAKKWESGAVSPHSQSAPGTSPTEKGIKRMAAKKKKRRPDRPAKRIPLSPKVGRQLDEAQSLARRGQWGEADALLRELARTHPRQPDVLTTWLDLARRCRDYRGYLEACDLLVALRPDDPMLRLARAGAYLSNSWPALALRGFREFLERWPNHPEAEQARQMVAHLESSVREHFAGVGLTGPDVMQLAVWHEEIQVHLDRGEYAKSRRVAEQLLQARPEFAPALNNMGEGYWREGDLAQAMACARRVLDFDPGNVHALANLTRYLCLAGQFKEAEETTARLRAVDPVHPDGWAKVAEARSCLGDDAGVLEAVAAARAVRPPPEGQTGAYLEHLGAVAAYRQGREQEARQRWEQALRHMPGFSDARANLDDLRQPIEDRHAAWPFPMSYWIPKPLIERLMARMEAATRRKRGQSAQQPLREFLDEQPMTAALVPVLLDRGDPGGRGFALRLAAAAQTPPLLEALRDFALGQRGPDEDRIEASQVALQAGLLSSGPIRMWVHGEWAEILLLAFELHDTPSRKHSAAVEELAREARNAIYAGDGEQAERLLHEALAKEPDAPDLLNNLADAYNLQGRQEESRRLMREIHARFPDYWFGRIGVARQAIDEGRLEDAQEILQPMLQRTRLHASEFAVLATTEVELQLARGQVAGARSWLEMFKQMLPDHPNVAALRRMIRDAGRKGLSDD